MTEERFEALLAKLNEDAAFREKLQAAASLDAFLEMARDAGFDVSKADWLTFQNSRAAALDDAELEAVVGGAEVAWIPGRPPVQPSMVEIKDFFGKSCY